MRITIIRATTCPDGPLLYGETYDIRSDWAKELIRSGKAILAEEVEEIEVEESEQVDEEPAEEVEEKSRGRKKRNG